MLYGRTPVLTELDRRSAGREGDRRHEHAVAEQEQVLVEQARLHAE